MKQFILIGIAVVVTSVTGHARLGESVDEITQRYGKPTLDLAPVEYIRRDYGDTQAWYAKGDLKVLDVFKDGKSQCELLAKQDTTATLSASEIRAFIEANAGTATWAVQKETALATTWVRSDGGARATLTADKKTLTVMISKGGSDGF